MGGKEGGRRRKMDDNRGREKGEGWRNRGREKERDERKEGERRRGIIELFHWSKSKSN